MTCLTQQRLDVLPEPDSHSEGDRRGADGFARIGRAVGVRVN